MKFKYKKKKEKSNTKFIKYKINLNSIQLGKKKP